MTGTDYPLTADGGPDDLPRTFRRAREEREQADREAAAKSTGSSATHKPAAPSISQDSLAPLAGERHAIRSSSMSSGYGASHTGEPGETTVTRLDIPFGHLSMFFVKAVFAAIPALILLIAALWVIGQGLELLFPELIKMKIQVYFPH